MLRNLYKDVLALVDEEHGKAGHDSRFGDALVKEVTSVDPSQAGGYMFAGRPYYSGTDDVEPAPRLFLVRTKNGSNRYQTEHYLAVTMDAAGTLHLHDEPYTTGAERGWALRMRDGMIALLSGLHPQAVDIEAEGARLNAELNADLLSEFSDEELLAELRRRGAIEA